MNMRDRWPDRNPARRIKRWDVLWKLSLCVVLLAFLTVDGYRSIQRFQYWWRNREIKKEYIQAVERLRQEQHRLKEEIHELKNRPLAQERLARDMGYIRPGETVYKLAPDPYDETE